MSRSIILTHPEIAFKIRRIAYQIYENNTDEKEIVIAGISKTGFYIAKKIKEELDKISDISSELCEVFINKKDPLGPVKTSLSQDEYKNKSVVLVDDVLNSGATLIYSVKHFLEVPLKRFKTAVLVNRSHKKYPVKADFKGISLSTSIQEHVTFTTENDEMLVYLE